MAELILILKIILFMFVALFITGIMLLIGLVIYAVKVFIARKKKNGGNNE